MKDYLNTIERDEFITFLKSLDQCERIVENWGNRNNLTKDELKNLRTILTLGKKAVTSIINRMNNTAKKSIAKTMDSSCIMLDYKSDMLTLMKKRCSELDATYEENRDYFKLVELIMHYNCKDCSRDCKDCHIYPEFEDKKIPEFSGWEELNNCKYSYKTEDKGE